MAALIKNPTMVKRVTVSKKNGFSGQPAITTLHRKPKR